MFEETFDRIAGFLSPQLLRGKQDIAFRDLINRPLPAYFWDFFNVIFDPKIGEMLKFGSLQLDHRGLAEVPDYMKELKNTLRFSATELTDLVEGGLASRMNFILSPQDEVATLIFDYRLDKTLPAVEIAQTLNSIGKVLENWSSRVHSAAKTIEPYLSSRGEEPLDKDTFRKVMSSAIEKEASQEPLSWVNACLDDLDSLLQLDPEVETVESLDLYEPVSMILKSRSLEFWMPAISVEKEIRDGVLSLVNARTALIRLDVFLKEGLLGPHHSEDLGKVEDEIEDFTGFLEEETG